MQNGHYSLSLKCSSSSRLKLELIKFLVVIVINYCWPLVRSIPV
jgi:hypothetical protein